MAATTSWLSWTSLVILILLYTFALLDRQILSLLVLPIQAEMNLGDGQLGLLQGLAFVVFYSLFGLIFGWVVDFTSRRLIIFLSVVFWSLSTIGCGLATSFGGLLIARMLVGFGEAALAPASLSLIASLFPRSKLPLANGIYFMGTNIGSAAFFTLGGMLVGRFVEQGGMAFPIIGEASAWQSTFIILGLAGLPAALLALCLHDRREKKSGDKPVQHGESLKEFITRRGWLLTCHILGFACFTSAAYALIAWSPTFYGRVHGLSPGMIGLILGISYGLCAAVGNYFWGSVIGRLIKRGYNDAPYKVFCVLAVISLPCIAVSLLIPNVLVSVVFLCISWLLVLAAGSLNAALHLFTPDHLRGRAIAIQMLVVALFSVGLTPWLIGMLTEMVFKDGHQVGLSMLLYIVTVLVAGTLIYWFNRRRLAEAISEDNET